MHEKVPWCRHCSSLAISLARVRARTHTHSPTLVCTRYVNEKVPFAWLKVLEQLQKGDTGSSIPLQQVLAICKDCGLPSTAGGSLDDEAMQMLKRFNDLGQLMHHQVMVARCPVKEVES